MSTNEHLPGENASQEAAASESRREFLSWVGNGLSSAALASLMLGDRSLARPPSWETQLIRRRMCP